MKKYNKNFAVSTKGMDAGSVRFNFRTSLNTHGRAVAAINEIRYSATVGKDRVWIVLPPSFLLSFIADGFESGVMTYFQHRVTTNENGTTEWGESGEVEIIVQSEELRGKN